MSYHYLQISSEAAIGKCICSQERAEEFSAENFSDIVSYVLSKLKNILEKSCCNGSGTESCLGSRYGTISRPSTAGHGEDSLISSAADSPVKTSASQERAQVSKGRDQGSGMKCRELLARFDRNTSSWRTLQCSLFAEEPESLETLPSWGMTADGELWELTMPERLTEGSESGYWRTPVAADASNREFYCNSRGEPNLSGQVKVAPIGNPPSVSEGKVRRMLPTPTCSDARTANMKSTQTSDDTMCSVTLARLVERGPWKMWPTPQTRDFCSGEPHRADIPGKQVNLNDFVKMYPTPSATDYKGSGKNGQLRDRLDYAVERGATKSKDYSFATPTASDYRRRGPNSKQQGLPEQVASISFPTPGTTGLSNGSGNCEKANQLYEQGVISEEERKSFRAGNGGQLNPDWTEWLMGWGIGWTSLEPMSVEQFQTWREMVMSGEWWNVDPADVGAIPRITDVKTHRTNRIKAIGNGQVPQTVVLAWTILSQGLEVAK